VNRPRCMSERCFSVLCMALCVCSVKINLAHIGVLCGLPLVRALARRAALRVPDARERGFGSERWYGAKRLPMLFLAGRGFVFLAIFILAGGDNYEEVGEQAPAPEAGGGGRGTGRSPARGGLARPREASVAKASGHDQGNWAAAKEGGLRPTRRRPEREGEPYARQQIRRQGKPG
jgi:hypothetical protein